MLDVQKLPEKIKKAGWSLAWFQPLILNDAQGYGERFIVHANEMRTAFVDLRRAVREFAVSFHPVS